MVGGSGISLTAQEMAFLEAMRQYDLNTYANLVRAIRHIEKRWGIGEFDGEVPQVIIEIRNAHKKSLDTSR